MQDLKLRGLVISLWAVVCLVLHSYAWEKCGNKDIGTNHPFHRLVFMLIGKNRQRVSAFCQTELMAVISFLEVILPNKIMRLCNCEVSKTLWFGEIFVSGRGWMCGPLHSPNNNLVLAYSCPFTSLWISRGCLYRGVEQGTSVDVKTMQTGLKVWVCCLGVFYELRTAWKFVLWGACCSVFQLSGCIRRQINVLFCHVSYLCPCLERETGGNRKRSVKGSCLCSCL